jgi:hypothetical protein
MAAHISGSPNGCDMLRRAVLRVLTVTALALAGLLMFGLLPGGRDASMVMPLQYPLPSVPAACDLHPHGPNRPLNGGHTDPITGQSSRGERQRACTSGPIAQTLKSGA